MAIFLNLIHKPIKMKVLEVPYNRFIGIKNADKEKYYLKLEDKPEYKNHLGTVHASAMFSLAEATSGKYLLKQFSGLELDIIPVVRKAEVKYSKPAQESVYSSASFLSQTINEIKEELKIKKRVIIKVKVEIFNEENEKLMASLFDWFVTTR